MLDFSFSEDQEMFRTTVKDFARKEIAPVMKARAETDPFALELRKKMGDAGRKRALENYDYRVIAKRFVNLVSKRLGIS